MEAPNLLQTIFYPVFFIYPSESILVIEDVSGILKGMILLLQMSSLHLATCNLIRSIVC